MPTKDYRKMCVAYGVSKRQKNTLQEENERLRKEVAQLSHERDMWKQKYYNELIR